MCSLTSLLRSPQQVFPSFPFPFFAFFALFFFESSFCFSTLLAVFLCIFYLYFFQTARSILWVASQEASIVKNHKKHSPHEKEFYSNVFNLPFLLLALLFKEGNHVRVDIGVVVLEGLVCAVSYCNEFLSRILYLLEHPHRYGIMSALPPLCWSREVKKEKEGRRGRKEQTWKGRIPQ